MTRTSSPPTRTPRWTVKQVHPFGFQCHWMTDKVYDVNVYGFTKVKSSGDWEGSWASIEGDPSILADGSCNDKKVLCLLFS